MNELKNSLLLFFEKSNKYYSISELRNEFKIKGEEQTNQLFNTLKVLEEEGSLFFNKNKGYKLFPKNNDMTVGKLAIYKKGSGFVNTNDGYSIFVPIENLNGALDGDTVIVNEIIQNMPNKYKGKVMRVLKRQNGNVVFESIGSGKNAKLTPVSIKHDIKLNISNNDMKSLTDGDLVCININAETYLGAYNAEIVNIIRKDAPDSVLKAIAFKNNIDIEFPKEVLEEANNISTEVTKQDFNDRIDLTDKEIYTTDCDNTKDIDDALGMEINERGNLVLYIAIADVSHYVKEGSNLYIEALKRGNSTYMDNSCIPMLPHKLSNGICSLNPNVNRLARTSIIEINAEGEIISFTKVNSIIKSRKKMKYSEVNKILENKFKLTEYLPHINSLNMLQNLSEKIEKKKIERGYIGFASTETNIIRDANGNIDSIKVQNNGKAEKMVENMMLLNNQLSAERYCYMPYIYRIHEKPDENKIKEIVKILNEAGFKININNKYSTNKTINSILNRYKNFPEFKVLSEVLLQWMKKARYSNECIGHFALFLSYYAHTTSPIRRCIDLVLQTYEKKYDEWEKKNIIPPIEEIQKIEKEFANIARQASIKERISDTAEREATQIRTAEYAKQLIGQTFTAQIYKVTKTGIFAIINNTIRGKINIDDILGDCFKFDEEIQQLIGKNTKYRYHIGKKIEVTLINSFPMTGEIYFKTNTPKINKEKTLVKAF